MKEHGGWIDVKSRVGEGSVFGLYFPLNPKLKTQRVQSGEKVHG
jgi:signal transduction histidine kinase